MWLLNESFELLIFVFALFFGIYIICFYTSTRYSGTIFYINRLRPKLCPDFYIKRKPKWYITHNTIIIRKLTLSGHLELPEEKKNCRYIMMTAWSILLRQTIACLANCIEISCHFRTRPGGWWIGERSMKTKSRVFF